MHVLNHINILSIIIHTQYIHLENHSLLLGITLHKYKVTSPTISFCILPPSLPPLLSAVLLVLLGTLQTPALDFLGALDNVFTIVLDCLLGTICRVSITPLFSGAHCPLLIEIRKSFHNFRSPKLGGLSVGLDENGLYGLIRLNVWRPVGGLFRKD
jgi:hypothetical protein